MSRESLRVSLINCSHLSFSPPSVMISTKVQFCTLTTGNLISLTHKIFKGKTCQHSEEESLLKSHSRAENKSCYFLAALFLSISRISCTCRRHPKLLNTILSLNKLFTCVVDFIFSPKRQHCLCAIESNYKARHKLI